MSKILAVFGATGQQGASVINHVLSDPELSRQYKIRAIARDVNSAKAKQLSAKVEVVRGDMEDQASLEAALTGAHTVFIMTVPSFAPNGTEVEYEQAKTMADVAVEKGAQYIILSTLPSPSQISGGKYTRVGPFESKARAERYIRGLPVKSAFFSGGYFMSNWALQPFLGPKKVVGEETWVISRPFPGSTLMPYFDVDADAGKFVGSILAEPDRLEGKVICAAQALYPIEECAAIISRATEKNVIFKQISIQEAKKAFAGLPPVFEDIFADAFQCQAEFGYWGPESAKLVEEGKKLTRGRLTTLEEFFQKHPLALQE